MTESVLPDDVIELLRDEVHSSDELVTVLSLLGATGSAWTVRDLSREACLSFDRIQEAVDGLIERGVLQVDNGVVSIREDEKRAMTLSRLSQAYADHQIDILVLMSRNAVERVREAAASQFDAMVRAKSDRPPRF